MAEFLGFGQGAQHPLYTRNLSVITFLILLRCSESAPARGGACWPPSGGPKTVELARIDQAGLLWLLNGDKLIALSENTAKIEMRTGAPQTFRRSRASPAACWCGNWHREPTQRRHRVLIEATFPIYQWHTPSAPDRR
jgi:hypothetical protein